MRTKYIIPEIRTLNVCPGKNSVLGVVVIEVWEKVCPTYETLI